MWYVEDDLGEMMSPCAAMDEASSCNAVSAPAVLRTLPSLIRMILIPALQWSGRAERTSFEVPTLSLHVHERIDPRSVIEAVRKKNGEDFVQGSLFSRL
jgi:hypothetical protein